jgi:hypothetical protein
MAPSKPPPRKKSFTVAEANATLPYVRAIIRDVVELAHSLRERQERLTRLQPSRPGMLSAAHQEELMHCEAELERGQERMREYEKELRQIGVELKDCFTGLVDFPAQRNGRPVYLCWRMDEPAVAHWHELEAGFAGRQKLEPERQLVPDTEGTGRD